MQCVRSLFQPFLLLALLATPVWAEPVSVNRGQGQGYVFTHRGNCYLILPDHVTQGSTRLSISTAAPAVVGDVEIFRTYAPDMDLAIGIVTSGLQQRCTETFERFRNDLQTILSTAQAAQLVRVDAAGLETRDDMTITSFDFETVTARVADFSEAEIYRGSSGGILQVGTNVIGMAVQSPGIRDAFFLRSDEIAARIGRLLDSGPSTPTSSAEPPTPPAPSGIVPQCQAGALPIRSVSCSVEPTEPGLGCSNLGPAGTGHAAFPHGAQPRLLVEIDTDQPVPLSSVSLSAANVDGLAVPQKITVEVSSAAQNPRWQRFGTADMSPLGTLLLANGARPYARQVSIRLESSWDPTLPMALACIALN